jgi:MoxR-like ATPase
VTIDGQTTKLAQPFFVIATQNPLEHDGTFPLPEAQLDRFLLKISMGYPSAAVEKKILSTHGGENPLLQMAAVAGEADVKEWQEQARNIFVADALQHYLVELVRATRTHAAVAFGASPRASLALYRAARALALLRGRQYVIPDDIQFLAGYILNHRLSLKREERLRGLQPSQVLEDVLTTVPVPVVADGV